jgi:hypothetical protein
MADILSANHSAELAWIHDETLRCEVRDLLRSFQRMGHVASALPMLLAARRRLANDPVAFRNLAHLLSTFCFRVYALCGKRSNAGQSHIRGLAKRLFDATDQELASEPQAMTDGLVWGIQHYAPDSEVIVALKDPNFYHALSGQETRYFFYEHEIHQCHGQEPALDWTTFANTRKTQIEHIWPQNRKGYWLGGDQDTHGANVNRLGNLTISHFNQKLSNRKFEDKKPIYARSNLIIENSLQHLPTWGLSEIAGREELLIEFAMHKWGI